MACPPLTIFLTALSQCHRVTPSMIAHSPTAPFGTSSVTERDKQLLADLRRASAMAIHALHSLSLSPQPGAESLEGAFSGHQSWAVLCRYRCRLLLAEVPKGSDRNADMKLWLQLWEAVKTLVSLLEEYWSSNIHNRFAGENKWCSHKLMNSAEDELVP